MECPVDMIEWVDGHTKWKSDIFYVSLRIVYKYYYYFHTRLLKPIPSIPRLNCICRAIPLLSATFIPSLLLLQLSGNRVHLWCRLRLSVIANCSRIDDSVSSSLTFFYSPWTQLMLCLLFICISAYRPLYMHSARIVKLVVRL